MTPLILSQTRSTDRGRQWCMAHQNRKSTFFFFWGKKNLKELTRPLSGAHSKDLARETGWEHGKVWALGKRVWDENKEKAAIEEGCCLLPRGVWILARFSPTPIKVERRIILLWDNFIFLLELQKKVSQGLFVEPKRPRFTLPPKESNKIRRSSPPSPSHKDCPLVMNGFQRCLLMLMAISGKSKKWLLFLYFFLFCTTLPSSCSLKCHAYWIKENQNTFFCSYWKTSVLRSTWGADF